MVPMPPNFTAANGDVNFEKSPLIFYVNGKKVSTWIKSKLEFFTHGFDSVNIESVQWKKKEEKAAEERTTAENTKLCIINRFQSIQTGTVR